MVITRYKPFFSVSVKYELAATGISANGIRVEPMPFSTDLMSNLRLRSKTEENMATVFYEGLEIPADDPVDCEPLLSIDTEEYFYFKVSMADKEKIKNLKFHSSATVAKNVGFPILCNALIGELDGPATITTVEDVEFISPVFSFSVKKSAANTTAEYAALEIKDENDDPVDLKIPLVKLTDKLEDEDEEDREFVFSVDASSLQPGVYSFTVGDLTKKFFIPTAMDISNAVLLIRVLKNEFLDYNKTLTDNSYAKFELLIPAA